MNTAGTLEIPLTRGLVALVDACDYDLVTAYGPWQANQGKRTFYARRTLPTDPVTKKRPGLSMHMLITGWPLVDHVNGNGLDNRRSNLRAATPSQNAANRMPLGRNNTSGYKGVYAKRGRWIAQINIEMVRTHIGYFDTPEEAARAYDAAALAHWGEWARLNFPGEVAA